MAEKRKTKRRKDEYSPVEEEIVKPGKEEYAVAKWLRNNVQRKKTKFLNHHVEYFTGSKAVDALMTSKWATGKTPIFVDRIDVVDFLHQMLQHKFFHRAKKVTVSEQELKGRSKKKDCDKVARSGDESSKDNKDDDGSKDTKEQKEAKEKEKRKRKIRLEMHLEQVFVDAPEAYVWIYDPIPPHYWLAGLALLLGAIGVCMFPLWPPTVRKGVYYLSVGAAGFLVLVIALATLRLVVFCAVWLLSLSRHHLWLLPNLTEDVGFFASFYPLYKYEYHGPSISESSSKKKKKKKDKCSDNEEEKAPLIPQMEVERQEDASASATPIITHPPESNSQVELEREVQTESESEGSQRSSTGKDFEMVDAGDVEHDSS